MSIHTFGPGRAYLIDRDLTGILLLEIRIGILFHFVLQNMYLIIQSSGHLNISFLPHDSIFEVKTSLTPLCTFSGGYTCPDTN